MNIVEKAGGGKSLDTKYEKDILKAQRNEITEYRIYTKLSKAVKDTNNSDVLKKIGLDEKRHYDFWREYTGKELSPSKIKIAFYYWISRIFGITFGIKLLEKGEDSAQINYNRIAADVPGVQAIIDDEDKHEKTLIGMLDEEKLRFMGSVVLGLNDALVELTGTLAGLTFALKNTRLIALAGLITGIAASFSMAASEYLSKKQEEDGSDALKSSIYTGIAYIVTVFLLILPFLTVEDYITALLMTLLVAVFIIFIFNYYISVAKDLSFKRRFFEMFIISMGVAVFSFCIGWVIRIFLGVEI